MSNSVLRLYLITLFKSGKLESNMSHLCCAACVIYVDSSSFLLWHTHVEYCCTWLWQIRKRVFNFFFFFSGGEGTYLHPRTPQCWLHGYGLDLSCLCWCRSWYLPSLSGSKKNCCFKCEKNAWNWKFINDSQALNTKSFHPHLCCRGQYCLNKHLYKHNELYSSQTAEFLLLLWDDSFFVISYYVVLQCRWKNPNITLQADFAAS